MALSKKKTQYFREKLLKCREEILSHGVLNRSEDLHVSTEDLPDEADLANSTITQQVSLSIRERELAKLRRIDLALERIENGDYGICIESGEPIHEKRLENQPWAEHCIEVAEDMERESLKHRRFA